MNAPNTVTANNAIDTPATQESTSVQATETTETTETAAPKAKAKPKAKRKRAPKLSAAEQADKAKAKQKEKEEKAKAAAKAKAEKAKAKEKAAKLKAKEKAAKDKAKAKAKAEKDKERIAKSKKAEKDKAAKEKAKGKAAADKAKAKQKADKAKAREKAKAEKDKQKAAEKAEKATEKARKKAEKDKAAAERKANPPSRVRASWLAESALTKGTSFKIKVSRQGEITATVRHDIAKGVKVKVCVGYQCDTINGGCLLSFYEDFRGRHKAEKILDLVESGAINETEAQKLRDTIQPRCIPCDSQRNKRKGALKSLHIYLVRECGVDGDLVESLLYHVDHKNHGLRSDGDFLAMYIDDTGPEFTPTVRGEIIERAYKASLAGLKLVFKSSDTPKVLPMLQGGPVAAVLASVLVTAASIEPPKPAPKPEPKAKAKGKAKGKAKPSKAKARDLVAEKLERDIKAKQAKAELVKQGQAEADAMAASSDW